MVRLTPDGRLPRVLVAWYGLYQAAHVVVNARALPALARGEPVFPAFPPAGGWAAPVVPWLLGIAGVDLANAFLAVAFVVGFAAGRRWWYPVGLVALSISVYSSLVFGVGTALSGAWAAHPFAYAFLYVAFLPVYLLFGLVVAWGLREAPITR